MPAPTQGLTQPLEQALGATYRRRRSLEVGQAAIFLASDGPVRRGAVGLRRYHNARRDGRRP